MSDWLTDCNYFDSLQLPWQSLTLWTGHVLCGFGPCSLLGPWFRITLSFIYSSHRVAYFISPPIAMKKIIELGTFPLFVEWPFFIYLLFCVYSIYYIFCIYSIICMYSIYCIYFIYKASCRFSILCRYSIYSQNCKTASSKLFAFSQIRDI